MEHIESLQKILKEAGNDLMALEVKYERVSGTLTYKALIDGEAEERPIRCVVAIKNGGDTREKLSDFEDSDGAFSVYDEVDLDNLAK